MAGEVTTRKSLRCLVIAADKHPCRRPDVEELFVTRLQARGHRFDWLMQSATPGAAPSEPLGKGTVFIGRTASGVGPLGSLHRLLLGVGHDLRLSRLARRQDYDLIIVKDKFLAALLTASVARRLGVPMVYWLSFPFPESTRYKAEQRRQPWRSLDLLRSRFMAWVLYRYLPPRVAHMIVQSEWMRADLAARGIPDQLMTAVPMGVSVESTSPLVSAADTARPLAAVYIGALNRARRLDFLLRTFRIVVDRFPAAELRIVGAANDPRDEEALRTLAVELGLAGNVEFFGAKPPLEAWKLVRSALIGVSPIPPTPEFLPSSPTKLVEYMALERAVVANDIPDQRFVVESSGAGLCVDYREQEFAESMITLFENPRKTMKMGRLGREWVAHHRSYAALTDLVEETLLRVCSGASNRQEEPGER